MKETYKVKCPERIVFGDPLYFREFEGERQKKLVVDLEVPDHFAAAVMLHEEPIRDHPRLIGRAMTIYLAPEKFLPIYMQQMRFESQDVYEKEIGVDSARYRIKIDDREDVIETGGDGYWGQYVDYTRRIGGKEYLDAVIIGIAIPDEMDMNDMRRYLQYFFQDVQQMENVEVPSLPEPEDAEGEQEESQRGYSEVSQ